MINAKLDHVKTLPEFYSEIRKQHEEAHGHDYCWQHDGIRKLMSNCETYKELGTHQGASAASACLTNPKEVTIVDIDFTKWRPFETLFRTYCDENNIEIESIVKLITKPLKEKLKCNATNLNYLKRTSKAKFII